MAGDWNLPDNPDRVDPPEDPGAPFCDVCGEFLDTPWHDCDGYYVCNECAKTLVRDTRKAPGWFIWYLEKLLYDTAEDELPIEGDCL